MPGQEALDGVRPRAAPCARVPYLAGQRPASPGEWLQVTAVDGMPGADFLAWVLPADGRYAQGGDVLVQLAADSGNREFQAVHVGVWAVVGVLLVPVAAWDWQDPDGWPEKIRATAAFALSVLTELEEHGANLGARRIDLDDAVVTESQRLGGRGRRAGDRRPGG